MTRAGYTVGVFVLLSPAQCRLLHTLRVATVQRRRLRASSTCATYGIGKLVTSCNLTTCMPHKMRPVV